MILPNIIPALPEVTGYKGFRKTLKDKGNLNDTLFHIERIARENQYQVRDLAYEVEGETVKQTAKNLWHFLRENTKYKLDTPGFEELRTPARSWHDRLHGIDCDDYTILISATLLVLGIRHKYKVTAYQDPGRFEHIYPVAIDTDGTEYVIDVVPEIPRFNYEQTPIIDLKTINMKIQELSGIGASPPSLADEIFNQMQTPLELGAAISNEDEMLESHFLQGLGEVETEEQADVVLSGSDIPELLERGILAEINKARATLMAEEQNPTDLSDVVNVSRELQTITNIMDSWADEEERLEVIKDAINQSSQYSNFYKAILVSLDELENINSGLSGIDDDEEFFFERVNPNDLEEIIEDAELLAGPKRSRRKGRLKNFFKKVGKGIKKGITAVVKHNPGMILLRGAILLAMKTNVAKVASTLIYGYLNEDQARNNGLDLEEWRKLVAIKDRAEQRFVKKGGKAKNFRNAVIKGRAAKKTGIQLGEVVTAAASTAAASGFIAFMKRMFKKINPARLFRKRKNRKKEVAETALTDESTSPSNDRSSDNMPVVIEDEPSPPNREEDTPQNSKVSSNAPENNPGNEKPSFSDKFKAFFSKNKKPILIVSLVLVVVLVVVLWFKSKKPKRGRPKGSTTRNTTALSGARKSKPKTIKSLKGSTTSIRVPTASMRTKKMSNRERLSQTHKVAKELQKKHPNTPYGKLFSRASKKVR